MGCKFNMGVDCDEPKCTNCGFNPSVEISRKAKNREMFQTSIIVKPDPAQIARAKAMGRKQGRYEDMLETFYILASRSDFDPVAIDELMGRKMRLEQDISGGRLSFSDLERRLIGNGYLLGEKA